jgi:CRISPR-associated protein Cas1
MRINHRRRHLYDLQEPYRWLVDFTVLRMVLSRTFSWDDFYFSDPDYRLRIKPPLLDRYVDLLREQFNSSVSYEGKRLMWDTVMLRKCQELAQYLLKKTETVDFTTPEVILQRSDTRELRRRILGMSQSEAHKLGIGKSTLHYLRDCIKQIPNQNSLQITQCRNCLDSN